MCLICVCFLDGDQYPSTTIDTPQTTGETSLLNHWQSRVVFFLKPLTCNIEWYEFFQNPLKICIAIFNYYKYRLFYCLLYSLLNCKFITAC